MKYSALLISALAVLAKAVQLTNSNYTVTEGQPFTITWTGSTDPVTIKLKTGASDDLKDVQTITSSGSGGTFTWTPENLPSGTYAFEITDSAGDVNYSSQFSYQGTGTLSTTSTASSTASTTESSSTSSETTSTTSSARLTSSTMTPLTNSTMSTSTRASTRSSTATVTSSSSTSTATEIPNTNNGQRVASSLALMFGAVVAFVAFN